MKNSLVLIGLLYFFAKAKSQTELNLVKDIGSIKEWNMSSGGIFLGKIYSIESYPELFMYPTKSQMINRTMVLTGTYTSNSGKIAGFAYDKNKNQIGDTTDVYFKPNAFLAFGSTVSFSRTVLLNSISVYQLIIDNVMQSSIIEKRTKTEFQWRFLVQKKWTKVFNDKSVLTGEDWMIVDFADGMKLSEACEYVLGLKRDKKFTNFTLTTEINACLLDTGSKRGFLLNGQMYDGKFDQIQSNVIIIN